MKEQEIYKKALEKYGFDAQVSQLHEEIGELMVAISKAKRLPIEHNLSDKVLLEHNVLSEIADVQIMLEQMKLAFTDDFWDFEKIKASKLNKLEGYLNEETHKNIS